jgi:hypothetical protein
MHLLNALWSHAMTLKWSFIAFVGTAVLGLVSMGALGIGLYYAAAPLLSFRYAPMNSWRGDWVWPTVIVVGMLWSVAFLAAGELNLYLHRVGTTNALRVLAYLLVLYLWNLVIWVIALHGRKLF